LAIDQGGHASRASLYTIAGELIGNASIPVHTHHPAPDQVEHDPEELVTSVQAAIDGAMRHAGSATIVAAGLATQRSSVVCWDTDSGAALSPVISWQDRRTAGWLESLANHAPEIRQRTGLPLSSHYGASKLRWCWDHLPAVRNAWTDGRLAWGPLASFLTYRLSEERTLASDPANASRTLLWNLDSSDWDPRLATLFAVPLQALPPCVDTRHDWGHLGHGRRRIPITVVTGDQSAALFAFAEPAIGALTINLGTGAFMQLGLACRPPPSRLLSSLAYQDQGQRIYALEGTVNGAGSALTWVTSMLGLNETEVMHCLPQWLQETRQPPLFLNGIAGLGTPYSQPLFASRFIGDGSAAEKCVAVCESIIFLLQVNQEEMARTVRAPTRIILSGGLSQLNGLCQRLADLSSLPLFRPEDHEATMQGVTRLLIGMPRAAANDGRGTTFLPHSDLVLEGRYRAWREQLEAAVVK
jgi:glycerol kinase